MCSWGSNQKLEKFYKGAHNDTPWNKDLLWRYHVDKEHKHEKVDSGELLPSDVAVKLRQQRMVMGMTGSLIPDMTPRLVRGPQKEKQQLVPIPPRALHSSRSRRTLDEAVTASSKDTARSIRTSGSRSHIGPSPSLSSLSSCSSSSSMRSVRLQDVQELLESQSRMIKEKTESELNGMRSELQEEARRREDAEKKIKFLCEKLGIEPIEL